MAVSRVTKIERRKGQTERRRDRDEKETRDQAAHERQETKERQRDERDGSNAFRSVARGEDGPPSKSSLVTMNGPNESRGPIKDYSRRRFAPTAPGRRLCAPVYRRCDERAVYTLLSARRWKANRECLHACLTFVGSHLIGTSKYTFRVVCSVSFWNYILDREFV